jgi:phasin
MNEMPSFENLSMEMPVALRELADKGVEQAKEHCKRMKTNANSLNSTIEAVYVANAKGTTDCGLKIIDIMRTNTQAAFSFVDKVPSAKSPMDVVAISSDHARTHLETITAKIKELSDLAQKTATDGISPIKNGMSKALEHEH